MEIGLSKRINLTKPFENNKNKLSTTSICFINTYTVFLNHIEDHKEKYIGVFIEFKCIKITTIMFNM